MPVEVYGIGELLVDIIPVKPGPLSEGTRFEIHFGGAPANTIVGVSRLGHKSGMIAAVGNDLFGDFLIRTLKENNVDTKFVVRKNARTTLAFVFLHKDGERSFFFYRLPWVTTADTMLSLDDIDLDEIAKAELVHVSGFSTSYPPTSNTILHVMKELNRRGLIVSYDPTFRHDIWPSLTIAREMYNKCLKYTTFLSMGFDELEAFHPDIHYKSVAEHLLNKYPNLEIVAIRLGPRGAYVRTRREEIEVPAFKVKVVDTTGAGDAWTAGFIVYHLLEGKSLKESTEYANAVAAITCTRQGAITVFPYREEVKEYINKYYQNLFKPL